MFVIKCTDTSDKIKCFNFTYFEDETFPIKTTFINSLYTKGYNIVKNCFPVEAFNTGLILIIHSDLVDSATGNAIIN